MKKIKFTAVLGLSLMMSASALAASDKTVDVFFYNLADPFIASVNKALHEQAESFDVKLRTYDAADDAFTQSEQFEVNNRLPSDGKLVNLVDFNYGKILIDSLKDRFSTMVFFNRPVDHELLTQRPKTWYVGADAVSSGRYQTEILVDYLKKHPDFDKNGNGVLDLVLIKGESTHLDTQQRSQAVIDTLNDSGIDYRIVYSANCDWSFNLANEAAQNFILRNKIENIEAVVCNNDAMALGVVAKLQEFGYNLGTADSPFIPVLGIDAIDDALKAIKLDQMLGTVYNDGSTLSRVALQIIALDSNDEDLVAKTIGFEVKDHEILLPYRKVQSNL